MIIWQQEQFSQTMTAMKCYLGDKGRVCINVGQKGEDIADNGFSTSDRDDVSLLLDNLSEMVKEMED